MSDRVIGEYVAVLRPSDGYLRIVSTKDQPVPPTIVANDIDQSLKASWITCQYICISGTICRHANWTNKEA